MPMFYYLTETRPALGQPWIDLYSTEQIISLEEERAEKDEIKPVLFIYSKVNTLYQYWPDNEIPLNERYKNHLNYLKYRYIQDYHYSFLWENDAFVVYHSPGEGR